MRAAKQIFPVFFHGLAVGGWAAAAALFLAVCGLTAGASSAQALEALPFPRQFIGPQILNSLDAILYRKIFALQSQGRISETNGLIAQISDRRLMGHVLSQRYLSKAYITSYNELQAWMANYAGHADAASIYLLALRKAPTGASALHRPLHAGVRGFSPEHQGAGYRAGARAPDADWVAGLAAWRRGQTGLAGRHFAALANSGSKVTPAWRKSAAAYWAARAALAQRNPAAVNQYLRIAARYPGTMYGILAHRQLGQELPFDWSLPQLTQGVYDRIRANPAVARIIALNEAGQHDIADKELLLLHRRSARADDESLLALAAALALPTSQMRIAKVARQYGTVWHAALYPVPSWRPEGGFTAEPALLYAIMRQESKFVTNAQSVSGARGVMQLMPATASFISKNRSLRGAGRNQLFDPELNMALGQRYIRHLLEQPQSNGDLLALVVAYQAGPGNMERWRARLGPNQDPLLFIESIPREVTRQYLDQVVADYWLYQARLGEAPRTLDALAAGRWPDLGGGFIGPQARVLDAAGKNDPGG